MLCSCYGIYLRYARATPRVGPPGILEISKVIGLTHHETGYLIGILNDAATAIKDMQVRGAALIGDYRISLLEVVPALSALPPRDC
jgi:hypothetical protein